MLAMPSHYTYETNVSKSFLCLDITKVTQNNTGEETSFESFLEVS